MQPTAHRFKQNAAEALDDELLQKALVHVRQNFIGKRRKAADRLPERATERKIRMSSQFMASLCQILSGEY